jgi:hypothetical protein
MTPGVTYTIRVNRLGVNTGDVMNKYINFDPNTEVVAETKAGPSPTPPDVTLVHEIGHVVGQGPLLNENDRVKHENENIKKHENPYRKQRNPKLPERKLEQERKSNKTQQGTD